MNLVRAIGRTPLVPLKRISNGGGAVIAAKLEGMNPGGSVKDRPALAMIERAERDGLLAPGGAIVEPTSGNTGIGLAFIASQRGYTLTVTMPESMSIERRRLLASYGARVVLTPAADGMRGAVAEAERIAREERAFMPQQFANPANPDCHRRTTGPEIWEETGGRIDILVCGVGTGGTITGTGEFVKSMKRGVRVVAVEPAESPVLGGGAPGPHRIEGLGAGFIPRILNRDVIDEIVAVSSDEARGWTRRLSREEGILAGVSSGAALAAAFAIAARPESRSKLIVTIFPDRGDRYLSTGIWD